MLVGPEPEMLDRLTTILRPAEQERVGSCGCFERELIESQALAAGLDDTGAGRGSEAERGDV